MFLLSLEAVCSAMCLTIYNISIYNMYILFSHLHLSNFQGKIQIPCYFSDILKSSVRVFYENKKGYDQRRIGKMAGLSLV